MCRNRALAKRRAHKRESLLEATEVLLRDLQASVESKRLPGTGKIGINLGQIIGRCKMKKHFSFNFDDHSLSFHRNNDSIQSESKLDGVYVICTSVSQTEMIAADCVRGYKSLCPVERGFRTIKTMHLRVRPIGCVRICSCACLPTMWNGICARRGGL